jgi:hypothetical protein
MGCCQPSQTKDKAGSNKQLTSVVVTNKRAKPAKPAFEIPNFPYIDFTAKTIYDIIKNAVTYAHDIENPDSYPTNPAILWTPEQYFLLAGGVT